MLICTGYPFPEYTICCFLCQSASSSGQPYSPHHVASRIIGKLSGLTNRLVYHFFIDSVILFCPDCSYYVKPIVKKMIVAINLYQKGLLWSVFCRSVHGFVKLVWPHYHYATNHLVLQLQRNRSGLVDINLCFATYYPENATKRIIRRTEPIVSQWFPSFTASSTGD